MEPTSRTRLLCTVLLVFSVITSPSLAKQGDIESLINIDAIEEEIDVIKNLTCVYGAARHKQRINQTPASVSIITAKEIADHGWRTVGEAVSHRAGFGMTSDHQYIRLGARGFNRPGDYNSRVLVLLDGQRLNDPIYSSGPIDRELPFDIDLVDRIEIIRGPASALYGTSALLAVINIIPRKGTSFDGTEMALSSGRDHTITRRVTYGKSSKKDTDIVVSASSHDATGRDLYFAEFDDPATNNGVADGSNFNHVANYFAKIRKGDWSIQMFKGNRKIGQPAAPWGIVFNDGRAFERDEYGGAEIKFEKATEKTSAFARVALNSYDFTGNYPYDWGPPDGIIINSDNSKGKWWELEGQISRTLQPNNKLTIGMDLRRVNEAKQMNFDADPFFEYFRTENNDEDSWALYLQDEWQVNKRVLVNSGLRYDKYEGMGGRTNPRIGVIIDPHRAQTWKLLYGKAFRVPSSYEKYYHDGYSTLKDNPALAPEEIITRELVYERKLSNDFFFSASCFDYDITGLISQVVDPNDGLLVFQNVDSVNSRGIELSISKKVKKTIIGFDSTLLKAKDNNTGEELSSAPRRLMSLRTRTALGKNGFGAALALRYVGERKTLARDDLGGHTLVDLTVSRETKKGRPNFSVSVYNLFDKTYYEPASEEFVQDKIVQYGRQFRLKVSWRF